MPFWGKRNSHTITQQDHQHHEQRNNEKKKKDNKKKGKYRENRKSFDESILLTHNSSTNSTGHDLKDSSISFSGYSVFWGFDADIGSEVVEKKAYPLPRPSSLPNPSIKFDKELVAFSSEMVLKSGTNSSCSSSSSSFKDDGVDDAVHHHGDFGSFRLAYYPPCFCKNLSLVVFGHGLTDMRINLAYLLGLI